MSKISLSGDYADYIVFSLEFLFLSIVVPLLHYSPNNISKVVRTISTIILIIGFVQTLIGSMVIPILVQDYSADKVLNFDSGKKKYQTRRYSFGFATLIDTRYTFKTYRKYSLPIEKLINEISFFDMQEKFDFGEEDIKVMIKNDGEKQVFEFRSSNNTKREVLIKE